MNHFCKTKEPSPRLVYLKTVMSGGVLDYEAKRIRDQGISIGRNEGISIGKNNILNELISKGIITPEQAA